MFKVLDETTEHCLVVEFSGNPTGKEVQQFVDEVKNCMEQTPDLNLVFVFDNVEGYGDTSAYVKDEKFTLGLYKKIHKAALVGDEKWITWWVDTIGPHTPAEEMRVPAGQLQAAVEWAKG